MLTDFCACTGCAILTIWPSFARKRVRRPRPSTSTCAQYICCADRCKRAPLRSRICLLRPPRPRAAASCGAAAAGQETSRSPAQGGRRPPAVLRGARRKAGPRATGGWLSSACPARLAALPALPTPVSARGLLDGRRPPGAPRAARSGRRPPGTRPGCGLDRGPRVVGPVLPARRRQTLPPPPPATPCCSDSDPDSNRWCQPK